MRVTFFSTLPCKSKLFKCLSFVGICSGVLHAGTFTNYAWTGDADTGIDTVRTEWAYSFGSGDSTVINGVNVWGIVGPTPANQGSFTFTGSAATSIDNTNELYNQGDGSATMASYFVFGGSGRQITLQGLYPGVEYTVSLFMVGFLDEGLGVRTSTLTSGSDSLLVDQSQFGGGEGYRLDYTFVATGTEREIDFAATSPGNTLHLYGLALRKEPIVVTSSSDNLALAGILRFAIDGAPEGSLITFDPALGNGVTVNNTISLQNSNFLINKDLTIDASEVLSRFGVPLGMRINGGNASRAFVVNKMGDSIDISLASGTTATQSSDSPAGSFPATNAIDGDLSTYSETDELDLSDLNGGQTLAPSLTIHLGRDVLMGSLKIQNAFQNSVDEEMRRLRNVRVELFDSLGGLLWKSGLLNPVNPDSVPNFGPNELSVVFPPSRVARIQITGEDSSAPPALSIAEVQAFAPAVTLRSLSIRNGQAGSGGGILNSGLLALEDCSFQNNAATTGTGGAIENTGDLVVLDCEFSRNSSGFASGEFFPSEFGGGAISNLDGTLAVHESRFSDNTAAESGGAISSLNLSESGNAVEDLEVHLSRTLTIENCDFEDNSAGAGHGGAIVVEENSLSVFDSRFVGNSANNANGGAVFTGDITFGFVGEDSRFQENSAEVGGAISSEDAVLTRCRLQGNSASLEGGAFEGGPSFAHNCFFAGNAAPSAGAVSMRLGGRFVNCSFLGNVANSGGALELQGTSGSPASIFAFSNTLLWDNVTNGSTLGTAVSLLNSPTVTYSRTLSEGVDLTPENGANLDGTLAANDPQLLQPVPLRSTLTPTTEGSPRFAPSSPLRDRGSQVFILPQTDLEGDPRLFGVMDIGAVELQGVLDELDYIFDFDPDQDGYPIGLELAIGSDPYVADFQHPSRLCVEIEPTGGIPNARVSFGVADEFQPEIILRLKLDFDLEGSFTTIRTNENTHYVAPFPEIFNRGATEPTFYQLEAERREAQQ